MGSLSCSVLKNERSFSGNRLVSPNIDCRKSGQTTIHANLSRWRQRFSQTRPRWPSFPSASSSIPYALFCQTCAKSRPLLTQARQIAFHFESHFPQTSIRNEGRKRSFLPLGDTNPEGKWESDGFQYNTWDVTNYARSPTNAICIRVMSSGRHY